MTIIKNQFQTCNANLTPAGEPLRAPTLDDQPKPMPKPAPQRKGLEAPLLPPKLSVFEDKDEEISDEGEQGPKDKPIANAADSPLVMPTINWSERK